MRLNRFILAISLWLSLCGFQQNPDHPDASQHGIQCGSVPLRRHDWSVDKCAKLADRLGLLQENRALGKRTPDGVEAYTRYNFCAHCDGDPYPHKLPVNAAWSFQARPGRRPSDR